MLYNKAVPVPKTVYLSWELIQGTVLRLVMHEKPGKISTYKAGAIFEVIEVTSYVEISNALDTWQLDTYYNDVDVWIPLTDNADTLGPSEIIEAGLPECFF